MDESNQTTATEEVSPPETSSCGATRELPGEHTVTVTCSRDRDHFEDHFDDNAGMGWHNEASNAAGLTQEERAHANLDRLGVPRGRNGNAWTLTQRLNVFVDRLAKRMHTQVENNMILYNTMKDALVLLDGAPNSSQYRIKTAIEKMRAVLPSKKTASGLHVM